MQVVQLVALALQNPVKTTGMLNGQPPADLNDGRVYLWIAIAIALVALGLALLLARAVIAADSGTTEMQAISNAIREGRRGLPEAPVPDHRRMIALVLAVVALRRL